MNTVNIFEFYPLSMAKITELLKDHSTFKAFVMDYVATNPRLTTNIKTYIIQDPLNPQNVKKSTVVRSDNIMAVVKVLLEKNKGLLQAFYDCLVNDLDEYMENGVLDFDKEFNDFLMLDQDYYFQEVGEFIQL